mgnify:CR=1 FL=1
MTEAEHQQRHAELHRSLDELVTDFITHTKCLPSTTTVLELMQWSSEQTVSPSHVPDEGPV